MSYYDYFDKNQRFSKKKLKNYKHSYRLNGTYCNNISKKRKYVEEKKYMNGITGNIIGIINNYSFPKYEYKLLVITKDNINNIIRIDDNITAITCINLGLTEIPKYIYSAKNVISLNCSYNDITEFEPGLFFSRLKMLNASFNRLKTLPNNMDNLEKLYVIYNNLRELPNGPELKTISCIHNNIRYIDVNLYPKMDRFYSYWNSKTLDKISRNINGVQPLRRSKRRKIKATL